MTITAMPVHRLGALSTSAQGLGCLGLSELRGKIDPDEAIATVRRAVELGVRLFDTANIYGFDGANERLLGHALKGRWSEVQIITKFGILREDKDISRLPGAQAGKFVAEATPEAARRCCEASLQRLGADVIDLYILHRTDPTVPIEESIGGMAELVHDGMVRYIGLSEVAPSTLRRANAVHPITAVQSEYSLWTRDLEDEILPICREIGAGLIPYCPLGRGFLTGTIRSRTFEPDDFRNFTPWFNEVNFDRNVVLADRLKAFAATKGLTGGQLALAWLRAQGDDIVPIPGTKRRMFLEENVAAVAVELSEDDLVAIEEIAPRGAVAGDRYVDMTAVNG
jgi:aryl-alcohol dehydrogenase-like predicted oxidoreductase